MEWFWELFTIVCNFDLVYYGCVLYGVGFHMYVVKFQDVGYEVLV